MRYAGALIAVEDVARSRRFYEGLLGQRVIADYGQDVAFEGGFSIHERAHFSALLDGRSVGVRANDAELYFEEDEVAEAFSRLEASGVEVVHPPREQPWRQLVARMYDPDGHIVELGEPLARTASRMDAEGSTLAEIGLSTYLSRVEALRAIAAYAEGLSSVLLETERLLLAPVRQDFAEEAFAAFTPAVATYMYSRPVAGIDETRAVVARSIEALRRGEDLHLAVLDKASGAFLGRVSLEGLGEPVPELGVWLAEAHQGRGLGREAVGAVVAWARDKGRYDSLSYPVDRRNLRSRRVAESLGGVAAREYKEASMTGLELDEIEYRIPVSPHPSKENA